MFCADLDLGVDPKISHIFNKAGMSETSPSHSQRPLQLSSYGISSDGSPTVSNTSIQSPVSPHNSVPHLGPTSRPHSGLAPAQYQNIHLAGANPRHSIFPQPYYATSTGPAQQPPLPGYHEISHGPGSYGDSNSAINAQPPGQQGQKRAYRQRRKDPSCDACRERKVKVCDAWEGLEIVKLMMPV